VISVKLDAGLDHVLWNVYAQTVDESGLRSAAPVNPRCGLKQSAIDKSFCGHPIELLTQANVLGVNHVGNRRATWQCQATKVAKRIVVVGDGGAAAGA
jgi:hypothetical protein